MPFSSTPLKGLLSGALLFFSSLTFAQDWKDPTWLRLLHYNETLFGGHLSEADAPSFFLTVEGKRSPKKELEALKELIKSEEPDELKNIQCLFPARIRWLKEKYPELVVPPVKCPKLSAWRDRVEAKSVSVVFSAYYLNNPSSSFGHTLIRLNKERSSVSETSTELLDTGINYGAFTGSAGPVLYTIGGLVGLFPGTFNALPYYYKVREYNDFETRDLWSYQLKLDQKAVDLMVDHIWELGQIHFDYFFLSENCSYHVLTIIEAVRPDVNLRRHLPYLYTIPSDTLKALQAEELVENVTFRAAPSTTFYHLLAKLDETSSKQVLALANGEQVELKTPPEKQALILDTAISLVDYKHGKEILKQDEKAQALKRPLLLARSKVLIRSPELDFSHKLISPPHDGHGSQRILLGTSWANGKNFTELGWRFAFHDFLDFDVAYPPRTRLEVVKATLRSDGIKHELKDLAFLDILSLGKWDHFTHSPSWKLKLGQWNTHSEGRDLSTHGALGGYGYSYHFKHWAPYLLAHGEASYVSESLQKMKLAYGADLGIIMDINSHFKFHTILELRAAPWNETSWTNELRLSNQKFGVGLRQSTRLTNSEHEVGINFMHYL